MIVALLAIAAGARAAAAWLLLEPRPELLPDTALYAQGGLGLFPSPLGRLVGELGGVTALAIVNVVANVALVAGAAALARARGARVWPAAAVAFLAPLAAWTIFAGVDTIAAASLVWAAAALERGHRMRSAGLAALAVGFHLAAVLVVAAGLLRARPIVAIALGTAGALLAIATPYRALVLELDPLIVASSAIATAAVFGLTFLPWLPRLELAAPAVIGGALAAGLVASSAWETNCRYMLPAVAIGAGLSSRSSSL